MHITVAVIRDGEMYSTLACDDVQEAERRFEQARYRLLTGREVGSFWVHLVVDGRPLRSEAVQVHAAIPARP